jgi:hypothetical protein
VRGGARFVARRQDAECCRILVHGSDKAPGQRIDGLAVLFGATDDLVVDVGDVADIGHLEAGTAQVAVDHVEHHQHARVPEMAKVVDGHAADVHPHLAGLEWGEGRLAACQAVVDLEHG